MVFFYALLNKDFLVYVEMLVITCIDVFVRSAMCDANNEERFQLQLGITEFILKQQVPLKYKRLCFLFTVHNEYEDKFC